MTTRRQFVKASAGEPLKRLGLMRHRHNFLQHLARHRQMGAQAGQFQDAPRIDGIGLGRCQECPEFCVRGCGETFPRWRSSLATNDRRGGKVGS